MPTRQIRHKNAFQLLPVAVKDFEQLGFCFNNRYYFDKALPFGCSISCATFENFSTFLEFAVRRRSPVCELLHYLTFLGGGKNARDCEIIMGHFQLCMSELGAPVANEKIEGPTTIICF